MAIVRRATFAEVVARISLASSAAPRAFFAIDVLLATPLLTLTSKTLSDFQQKIAVTLLESLLAAALAIEPDLATGATESAQSQIWRTVDLPAITAIVTATCPASSALSSACDVGLVRSGELGPGLGCCAVRDFDTNPTNTRCRVPKCRGSDRGVLRGLETLSRFSAPVSHFTATALEEEGPVTRLKSASG